MPPSLRMEDYKHYLLEWLGLVDKLLWLILQRYYKVMVKRITSLFEGYLKVSGRIGTYKIQLNLDR